jgi:acetamidase/formamidase
MLLRCALMMACALAGQAETHRVFATRFYNSFHNRHEPLLRVKSGDVVVTRTIDASGRDESGKVAAEGPNPLTGPFYIEGAEAGDSIAVTFRRMRSNRDWGFTNYRLGLFALNPNSIETLYPNRFKADAVIPGRDYAVRWDLDLAKGTVRLHEPVSKVHAMEFAAEPMMGCVGVAAPGDFGPSSSISGPYGGNIDYNRIGEGTTLILPVYHPGALFFLGDGHALQADGEPLGTGIEVSMDVEFAVELRKKAGVGMPRLETPEFIVSIGSQPEFASPLDRALQLATSDMAGWLQRGFGMEPWAAHLLIGVKGQYDVVTVAGSVGLRLPRSALPKR